MFEANIYRPVSLAESLAVAVNLRLSNDQLRKLRLWTRKWGVFLAAERQARSFACDQMGEVQIGCEMVQARSSCSEDSAAHSLKPAAFAWVKNPVVLVCQHLESLWSRNLLTWHQRGESGPSLPKNEVWVKIGGDKGGGSFKMTFHIVIQAHPNSPDHTTAFVCREAEDCVPNLHIALDGFKLIISELQGMRWK